MAATNRAIILTFALMSGAGPVHAQAYMNFECADGARLSLIFEKPGTALIMVGGGALRLQNRKPASGLWYASPHGDFRAAGVRARFRMSGRAPTTCVKVGNRP
ncbi:MliC family protein [uncultured Rhodoblastus sp.]|uniref:MliC family protein n=1 Tax=uncultured Rhodoblastus sp. TaxID=543037 RepID=UPI0025CD8DA4|nr:MliC family protein [uncultured Rhodoblastus sp.]